FPISERSTRPLRATFFPSTPLFRSDLASDAEQALVILRLAAARGRPFTMALIDMAMPDGDGLALVEAIRRDPAIPPLAIAIASSDRKSTRLNSSHVKISYAVFCLKK